MELLGRTICRQANLMPSRSYQGCRLLSLSPQAAGAAPGGPYLDGDGRLEVDSPVGAPSRLKRGRVDDRSAQKIPGGVEYFGFTYFPRAGEVDPPYEPSKLFRVRRTTKLACKPWWDKKTMWELGLGKNKRISEVVILKNTPWICKQLYKVKHLVEIVPITFPNGVPKDTTSGFLKEDGVYETYSDIGQTRAKNLDAETNSYQNLRRKELNYQTIKKRLHRTWFSRYDANI